MAEGSGRWQTKHIHVLEGDIGLIKYMRGVHDWHEKRGLHSFFMGYGIRWWLGSQRSIWIWNNLKYKTTTWLFKFHIYTVLKVKMPTSAYLQEPLGRLNGSSFEKYEHLNFSQIRLSLFYQLGCDLMHHKTTTKVTKNGRDWMKKVRTLFHPIGGLPTTMMPSHATWGADDMIADDCIVKYEVQDLFGYRSAP